VISGWVLGIVLFFAVVLGVIIVLLMRILTQMEILVRAIPFGSPKFQERRPPSASPVEEQRTRPVGSTGRHA
jgi:uncharacterized membrane protein YqiK